MSNNTEITNLSLSDIKVDQACQARVTTNATTIAEYAEIMMEEGNVFPPVVIYYDGTDHWLSDGFHRHAAAQKAELDSLKTEIRQGTRRDAILYGVGANATLRRTREDKRHAVGILLGDEEWSKWSNRTIAHRCGVDEKLVRTLRSASAAKPQIPRKVERNGKTYDMSTDNIGKKDGLDELLSVKPDGGVQPDQTWLVMPDTRTTEDSTADDLADDEPELVSDPASGTEEVQLQELLSAWSRASEGVQQRFLASIGVSIDPWVAVAPGVTESEPTVDLQLSQVPCSPDLRPTQATEPSDGEVTRENALFEIWKTFKPVTRSDGFRWVADSCPSVYRDTHFKCTGGLVPFRQAARQAPQEWAEFLHLARAHQAENQYS